jgi:hypothetical protein
MLTLLVYIVVVCLVAGILAYILRSAPFVEEPFKSWGVWAIIVVALLIIMFKILEVAGISLG